MSLGAYSAAVGLAWILLVAGLLKVRSPTLAAKFLMSIGWSASAARVGARTAGMAEAGASALLVAFPYSLPTLLYSLAICFLLFATSIFRFISGYRTDCGCFGGESVGHARQWLEVPRSASLLITIGILATLEGKFGLAGPSTEAFLYGSLLGAAWFLAFVIVPRIAPTFRDAGTERSASDEGIGT